ncbi:MAG TPA: hypothetical protein DGG94_07920, partial [Micromonosporaceae bacterium]|nr:hypothetical protein [Micromonosporaceae bacterium]
VGLTRAQRHLFLSHSSRRATFGTERDMRPAPFLADIDSNLVEQLGDFAPRQPRDQQLRLL